MNKLLKKLWVLSSLFLTIQTMPLYSLLLTKDGSPKQNLQQLSLDLQKAGVLPILDPSDREQIHYFFQSHLLRPAGLERWQLQELSSTKISREQVLSTLTKLGFLAESEAELPNESYSLVVFGARLNRSIFRLSQAFKKLSKNNLTPNKVYILTGNRKLEAEEIALLKQFLEENGVKNLGSKVHSDFTETHMLQILTETLLPKNWKHLPIIVSDCIKANTRPNTEDSVLHFLRTVSLDESEHLLSITETPYSHRLNSILINQMQKNGIKAKLTQVHLPPQENSVSVLLDELARLLYTERKVFLDKTSLSN